MDNIQVHINNKGKVCSTILDYSMCSPIDTNTHQLYYNAVVELPNHLPPDVLEPYCQGDLVDRFSLCRLSEEICSKLSSSEETKLLRRTTRRGLMARAQHHAIRRPKALNLAELANKLVGNHTHITWPYDSPITSTDETLDLYFDLYRSKS